MGGIPRLTQEVFVKRLREISPTIRVDGRYTRALDRVKVRCLVCLHKWSPEAHSLLRGHGCPLCGRKRAAAHHQKSHAVFVEQLRKISPTVQVDGRYIGVHVRIKVHCLICQHPWSPEAHSLLQGHGCPLCSGNASLTTKKAEQRYLDFVREPKQAWHGVNVKYKFNCETHGEYKQIFESHKKNGCPKCGGNVKLTMAEAYARQDDLAPGQKTWHRTSGKLWYMCKAYPPHDDYLQEFSSHSRGCGCPRCREYEGERIIAAYLTTHGILFEREVKFTTLKDKRVLKTDFFLPDYLCVIEYQGKQHDKIKPYWCHTAKSLQEGWRRDRIKKKWFHENDVTLICIHHTDLPNIDNHLGVALDMAAAEVPCFIFQEDTTNPSKSQMEWWLGPWHVRPRKGDRVITLTV